MRYYVQSLGLIFERIDQDLLKIETLPWDMGHLCKELCLYEIAHSL